MRKNSNFREQGADFAHLVGVSGKRDVGGRQANSEKSRDSLARRLRTGDREAATELVDTYYEQVYWFMRRLGHSRQAGEDLTQETFLQAWQHVGQLRTGKALQGWLYRIALNVSKVHWRRHKEAVSVGRVEAPDTTEMDCDKVAHYEELERLQRAVLELSVKLRQAVVLHYLQRLSIAEAAEAAGVSAGTFKSRLHRALAALRKQVASEKENSDERRETDRISE